MTDEFDERIAAAAVHGGSVDRGPTEEPTITINGRLLSRGQAITVRIAVTTLMMTVLEGEAPLGTNEHGIQMTALYKQRCTEIIDMMAMHK
jgi:hypothetical protein